MFSKCLNLIFICTVSDIKNLLVAENSEGNRMRFGTAGNLEEVMFHLLSW